MNSERRPRITYMGEELEWDTLPDARAVELNDHFKPVRLSPLAIDQASKIVPSEYWKRLGLHTWLSKRADHVFSKLTSEQREGRLGVMKYTFDYDAQGPVLRSVTLG